VYGRVANPQEGDFTTYKLLSRFKKVAYAAASVGAVCSLAVAIRAHQQRQQNDTSVAPPLDDAWAAWVCVGCAALGIVVVPLLEFIARNASATAAPLSPFESTVDRARRLLLQLEQQLADAGCMGAAWMQQRGAWRRRVESAMRLSTVAAATMYLESCIRAVHLNAPFLRTRAAWLAEIKSLVDPVDEDEVSVTVVVNAMYANSGRGCGSSCGWSSRDYATTNRTTTAAAGGAPRDDNSLAAAVAADQRRHDALIRAVQGIVNGVGAADDATNVTPAPTCAQNENQTAASQIRDANARPSAAADDNDDHDESEEGEDSAAQGDSRRPRTNDAAAGMLFSSRGEESERVLGEERMMPARTTGVDGDGDADESTGLHPDGGSGQGAQGGGGMRLSLRRRVPSPGAVVVATSGATNYDPAATLAVQNAAADIEAALTETVIDDDPW
jgi:hypothetical protein